MNLPQGRRVAESTATISDLLKEYSLRFKGSINVRRQEQGLSSEGFILLYEGTVLGAAFSSQGINLYQLNALDQMMSLHGMTAEILEMTDDEIKSAIEATPAVAIKAAGAIAEQPIPKVKSTGEYDQILSLLTSLPGVSASALVADGLPVFQHGICDFEHIAAATEDMVRSGSRISAELQLGPTDQIILETPTHKVIIAPVSDMFLCVLAGHDTNLGLIRLNIKNLQMTYNTGGN